MEFRKLRMVEQQHTNGCFIACLAMLTGKTYRQAFSLIHPDKDYDSIGHYEPIGLSPEESIKRMEELGLGPDPRPLRNLVNLRRTALIMIRWKYSPTLLHGIVFDASTKQLLNPNGSIRPLSSRMHSIQSQLDTVLYFKTPELSHRVTD